MEIINSFTDTIKERTKNPFFGTLILIWLFRNWEVVFAIFNFEKNFGLHEKLDFINDFYKDKSLWGMFFENIGIALCMMILGYALAIATRVLVNIVENRTMPYLNSKTVSKLVVNNSTFQLVRDSRDELQKRYDEQREAVSEYQKQVANSESEVFQAKSQITTITGEKNEIQRLLLDEQDKALKSLQEFDKLQSTVREKYILKTEYIEKHDYLLMEFMNLYSELKMYGLSTQQKAERLPDGILQSYRKLYDEEIVEEFYDYYQLMIKNQTATNISARDFIHFSDEGLIDTSNPDEPKPTAKADLLYTFIDEEILNFDLFR